MPDVLVYSKSWCPFCIRAKRLLESKSIEFTEIDVEEHPTEFVKMLEKSNGGRSVPQIFINDEHIGGCDDLHSLDAMGKLEPLFSES
ncbi:MAG: glutaredoxin 3 [bacterium]|jgi:glutaredoxin 3